MTELELSRELRRTFGTAPWDENQLVHRLVVGARTHVNRSNRRRLALTGGLALATALVAMFVVSRVNTPPPNPPTHDVPQAALSTQAKTTDEPAPKALRSDVPAGKKVRTRLPKSPPPASTKNEAEQLAQHAREAHREAIRSEREIREVLDELKRKESLRSIVLVNHKLHELVQLLNRARQGRGRRISLPPTPSAAYLKTVHDGHFSAQQCASCHTPKATWPTKRSRRSHRN